MVKINNVSSAAVPAANSVKRVDDNFKQIWLKFDPPKTGTTKPGEQRKLPLTITVTEEAAEKAILKHFGFDIDQPKDLARAKQLLKTQGSPLQAMQTCGDMTANYNKSSGKYETFSEMDKAGYR